MKFHFSTEMRNYMDENHQNKTESKLQEIENKLWLPPLSPKDQQKLDHLRRKGKKSTSNWTGFAGKTLWEWFLLLGTLLAALGAIAIPFVVTIIGLNFTQQQAQLSIAASERQHQTDIQIARDQQQAAILQTYIDNIQDLLLNHNLRQSKSSDEVAILARARTLTALGGLDPERRGRLLIFLYGAQLIGFEDTNSKLHNSIINLSGADLFKADLSSIDLAYTKFNGTDLSGANLNGADLSGANLSGDNLSGVNLSNAGLAYTDLSGTYLSEADLSNTILSFADLSDASNLTQQQLDQVLNCRGTRLPEGLTCHANTLP